MGQPRTRQCPGATAASAARPPAVGPLASDTGVHLLKWPKSMLPRETRSKVKKHAQTRRIFSPFTALAEANTVDQVTSGGCFFLLSSFFRWLIFSSLLSVCAPNRRHDHRATRQVCGAVCQDDPHRAPGEPGRGDDGVRGKGSGECVAQGQGLLLVFSVAYRRLCFC